MTRRPAGTGAIDWRIVGGVRRARVRLRLPDGTRRPFYAPPEVQDDAGAEAFRAALVAQLEGTPLDPRMHASTLGAWGLRWLDERERTHRDAAGDRQRWMAHVAGTDLAALKLEAIEPGHLRDWYEALLATPTDVGETRARQTVMNARTTLRACLKRAAELRMLADERLALLLAVPLPRGSVAQDVESDEPWSWLTVDELVRVLDALDVDSAARAAFAVALFTGLRPSEMHRLTWDRIDLRAAVPTVLVVKGKNGRAQRTPLLTPAVHALEHWQRVSRRTSGVVWPGPKGGAHARGYDWGWSDHEGSPGIASRARVRADVTWYDATRHTCASHLLQGTWAELGWTERPFRLEEVSRWLRHSSLTVTQRYAHLALDSLPIGSRPRSHGSQVQRIASHLRDLNSGPTVYEARAGALESLRNRSLGTLAAEARRALEAIAAQEPAAVALATRALAAVVEAAAAEERERAPVSRAVPRA